LLWARLEDLLWLFGPPLISLPLAMVRPLNPAPLAAFLLFEELDLLIVPALPTRVLEREMLSLLEMPIEALLLEP